MSVWILTTEYNQYDQHGEYFINVFADKPTRDQLFSEGVCPSEVDRVLNGGGWLPDERVRGGSMCWHLREQELTR